MGDEVICSKIAGVASFVPHDSRTVPIPCDASVIAVVLNERWERRVLGEPPVANAFPLRSRAAESDRTHLRICLYDLHVGE